MPFRSNSVADRLIAILIQEREALRKGALDSLSEIARQKERMSEVLQKESKSSSIRQIQEIQRRCDEVAILHQAAIDGLKSAQTRVSSLKKVDQTFHTYTAGGQKCHITASDNETRF